MSSESPQHTLAVHFPWQVPQWLHLCELRSGDRLPHALLLGGPNGVGKRRFAKAIAHSLLCEESIPGNPCGECRHCHFNLAGMHSDLKVIEPEEAGKQIKVDQVRGILDFIAQTSQQGGCKVVIIEPAEAMNINAANALLKSLEEPTDNTVIILVSDAVGTLLPTIRSRCQLVSFPVPPPVESLAWLSSMLTAKDQAEELLRDAGNRPLAALALVESGAVQQRQVMQAQFIDMVQGKISPLQLAELWKNIDLSEVLAWLQLKVSDLIRFKQGGVTVESQWQALVIKDQKRLFLLLDVISSLQLKVSRGANPNKQLALEDILLRTCEVFRR